MFCLRNIIIALATKGISALGLSKYLHKLHYARVLRERTIEDTCLNIICTTLYDRDIVYFVLAAGRSAKIKGRCKRELKIIDPYYYITSNSPGMIELQCEVQVIH